MEIARLPASSLSWLRQPLACPPWLTTLIKHLITSVGACMALYGLAEQGWIAWHHGRLTSLALCPFYLLLLVLLVSRRPASNDRHDLLHWMKAMGGTFLPILMITQTISPWPWLVAAGFTIQVLGIVLSVVVLSQLGRSFGVIAAHRGVIKTQGLYRWVRHPLYMAEELMFIGVLLQCFCWENVLIVGVQWCCQMSRAADEEALLGQDPAYVAFQQQTPYRFLPGIY
jgi:protein-S-isoprenylcysteine O-methyltransferase Ste14